MVQFFETPTAGIYDNLREVNDYWAADHDAAQRRYADREARRTYASAQRRNMAVSMDNEQFYNQNAGLLDDRTGMLAGIGQRNVPNATPTNTPQLLGAPGGDPVPGRQRAAPVAATTNTSRAQAQSSTASPPVVDINADMQSNPEPRQYTREELRRDPALARRLQDAADRGEIVLGNMVGGNIMVYPREGNAPGQIGPFVSGPNAVIGGVEIPFTSGFGIDPRATAGRWGFRPLTPRSDLDYTHHDDTDPLAGVRSYAENQGGTTDETQAGLQSDGNDGEPDADADDGTSDYFQGINDTSTPLRPTPEMRMTQATAAHMFRRAQILAHHGDNNGADVAFGAALQSHLATVEQSRMLMYQAAAGGSRDAAAMLIADTSGLDPSRVQLQATPERVPRFIVRIDTTTPEQAAAGTPPNWVSSNAEPLSRDSLVGTLLNLADRAGAAGRAELSANLQESMLRYRGTLEEIAGRERDNIRDNLTRAEIAQLDSATRIALAQGEGRMMQDSQTGNIWLVRPGVDANGRPTSIVTVLRTQDLPTANVDDNPNETVPTPTATRVN